MKLNNFLYITVLSLIIIPTFVLAQHKEMINDKKMMKDGKSMIKNDTMSNDMIIKIDKDDDGFAIMGYDVVSYFTEKNPTMGNPKFKYVWMGAKWQFNSERNLNIFKDNPKKFAPQYGGYCAYAVSKNMLAPVDPTAWKIVEGKLYLNNSSKVQRLWVKDISGNIKEADKNWKKLGIVNAEKELKKMRSMK